MSEEQKQAMGQFLTTCFDLNDPLQKYQAVWSEYGFQAACDYMNEQKQPHQPEDAGE